MKYLLCQPDTHNGFVSLTNGTLAYFSVECPHYQSLPYESAHVDKKALRTLAAKLVAPTTTTSSNSSISGAETLVHVEDMVALPGPFHTQHVCFGVANYSLYEANLCFVGSTLSGLLAVVLLPGRELIYAATRDPDSVRLARQRSQTTSDMMTTSSTAVGVPEVQQGAMPAETMNSNNGGPSTITWVRNKPLVLVGYSHGLVEWYEVSVSTAQRARWRALSTTKSNNTSAASASTTMPAASFAHYMSNPSLFRVQQVYCDGTGSGVEVKLRAHYQVPLLQSYRSSPHSVLLTSDYFPHTSDVAVGGEGGVYIFSSTELGSPLCYLSSLSCHFLYCHPFLPFIGALVYGQGSTIAARARRHAEPQCVTATGVVENDLAGQSVQTRQEHVLDVLQQQPEDEGDDDETVYKERRGSDAGCCCTFCLVGYHNTTPNAAGTREHNESNKDDGEQSAVTSGPSLRLLCHYALLAKTPRYDAFYSFSWKFSSALELVVSNVEEGKVSVLRLAQQHTSNVDSEPAEPSQEKETSNVSNNNNAEDAMKAWRVVHEHRLRLPLHSLINVEYISAATATLQAPKELGASQAGVSRDVNNVPSHSFNSHRPTSSTQSTWTSRSKAGRSSFIHPKQQQIHPSYATSTAAVPPVRTIMLKEDQLAAEVLQPTYLTTVHTRRAHSRAHKSSTHKVKKEGKKKSHKTQPRNEGETTTKTHTCDTSPLPTPEELHLLQQQQYQRSRRTSIGRRIAEGLENVPEVADYRRKLREITARQQQHHRQPPVRTLEREAAEAELRTRLHIGPGAFTNLLGMNSAGELECTTVEPNVCATWHEEGSVFASLGATVCSAELIRIQGIEHVMKQRLEAGFGLSAAANARALRLVSGDEHADMALLFAYIATLERTGLTGPIGPVPSVLQLFTTCTTTTTNTIVCDVEAGRGNDQTMRMQDKQQDSVRRRLLLRVLGWSLTSADHDNTKSLSEVKENEEDEGTTSIDPQALLDSFTTSKNASMTSIERAVAMLVLHEHYTLAATLLERFVDCTPVYLSLARLLRRPQDALGMLRTSQPAVRAVFLNSLSPWLLAVILHLDGALDEATACKQRLYTQPELSLWDRLAMALLLEPTAEALVKAMQEQLALHCTLLQALVLERGICLASVPQMQEIVDRTGDFQLGACLYARVGIVDVVQNSTKGTRMQVNESTAVQEQRVEASPLWPFVEASDLYEPSDPVPLVQRADFLTNCTLPATATKAHNTMQSTVANVTTHARTCDQAESCLESESSEMMQEWWWQWVAAYRTFLDNEQAFVKRTTFDVALQRLRELSAQHTHGAGNATVTGLKSNELYTHQHTVSNGQQYMENHQYDSVTHTSTSHNVVTSTRGSPLRSSPPPPLLQHIASVTVVRCAICLQPVTLQCDDVPSSLAWCLTCQHGGHARHLQDWFARHRRCPVEGCSCHCDEDANFY